MRRYKLFLLSSNVYAQDSIAISLLALGADVLPSPAPARSVLFIAFESGRKEIIDKVCMRCMYECMYVCM